MGTHQSRPATASPSAAFGRLRISSPASTRSIRLAAKQRAASLTGLSERSPLMIRKLESLPSGVSEKGSPPLIVWIGPALICALSYALYNIFIKKGSATIHPILGGVILQFVAAILGTVLLSALVWKDGAEGMNYDQAGINWAILAGAAVGAAEMLSFCVSGMGVQATQSIPIIIGGSVMFGTILGYVALQEMLTYQGWIGVLLIAVGIGLVGTDPGGAGSVHG